MCYWTVEVLASSQTDEQCRSDGCCGDTWRSPEREVRREEGMRKGGMEREREGGREGGRGREKGGQGVEREREEGGKGEQEGRCITAMMHMDG